MLLDEGTPPTDIRGWLRGLPSLSGTPPVFAVGDAPDDPVALFLQWIRAAVSGGVPEPHAATLATTDADGLPDARTLLLKDVDAGGWAFAGPLSSRKGIQLEAGSGAALNFWWQSQVRAVRVRGPVRAASTDEAAADLAARSALARGDVASGDWGLWRVVPQRVEFWQGSPDRRHVSLVYEREGEAWTRRLLTPSDRHAEPS